MTLKRSTRGAAITGLAAVTLAAMLLVVTAEQAVADVTTTLTACSAGNEICKVVTYTDNDGIIQIGEPVTYTMVITVSNDSGSTWVGALVTDTFGSELAVALSGLPTQGIATLKKSTTKWQGTGTNKWKLSWNIGDLPASTDATLTLTAVTDTNPGGNDEYTSCGLHVVNGGANLRFGRSIKQQQSFNTGALTVTVACP